MSKQLLALFEEFEEKGVTTFWSNTQLWWNCFVTLILLSNQLLHYWLAMLLKIHKWKKDGPTLLLWQLSAELSWHSRKISSQSNGRAHWSSRLTNDCQTNCRQYCCRSKDCFFVDPFQQNVIELCWACSNCSCCSNCSRCCSSPTKRRQDTPNTSSQSATRSGEGFNHLSRFINVCSTQLCKQNKRCDSTQQHKSAVWWRSLISWRTNKRVVVLLEMQGLEGHSLPENLRKCFGTKMNCWWQEWKMMTRWTVTVTETFVSLFFPLSQYGQQYSSRRCDLIQHVLETKLKGNMSDEKPKVAVEALHSDETSSWLCHLIVTMKFKDQAMFTIDFSSIHVGKMSKSSSHVELLI